jgi:hypothetical protein
VRCVQEGQNSQGDGYGYGQEMGASYGDQMTDPSYGMAATDPK